MREHKIYKEAFWHLKMWYCSYASTAKSMREASRRAKKYKGKYIRREYKRILERES